MPSIPSSYTSPETLAALASASQAQDDYRAIVCVFLFGGADTHYMLHPRQGANRAAYDVHRGRGAFRPEIDGGGNYIGLPVNDDWGFAPAMAALHGAGSPFANGHLATMINVGFLKEPTTRATYLNGTARRPEQLESHNTQQELWQALPPFIGLRDSGWMGRLGELAHGTFNPASLDGVNSVFSTNGRVLQAQGYETDSVTLNGTTQSGSAAFAVSAGVNHGNAAFAPALTAARSISPTENRYHRTFVARVQAAIAQQTTVAGSMPALDAAAEAEFVAQRAGTTGAVPGIFDSIANQFRTVARLIQGRSALGQKRQIFFVSLGGWDNHENLMTNVGPRFEALARAMRAFYDATNDLGVQSNVTTVTASEFNRTLVINGTNGSDHAWGGHMLVMGGSVQGGVYGSVDMRLGAGDDYTTTGRYIPTMSVEQMLDPVLRWWGLPAEQVPLVLPNLGRFPRNLAFMGQPAQAVPPAALRLDFMGGYEQPALDPRITATGGSGPHTRFNERGEMEIAPHNLCVSTDMAGARVGRIGAGGQLPNGWEWSPTTGSPNLFREVVAVGKLADGTDYIDLRWVGVASAGVFPHVYLTPGGNASPSDGRSRVGFSLMVGLVAGALPAISGLSVNPSVMAINGTTYVSDSAISTTSATASGFAMRTGVSWFPNGPVTQVRPFIAVNISAAPAVGTALDFTLRIARPHAYFTNIDTRDRARDLPPPPFVPNPTAAPIQPLPFDHDPVTLRRIGFRHAATRTNRIWQSSFGGNEAFLVTPGHTGSSTTPVWPAGWSVLTSGGVAFSTNFAQIVRTGVERGMSFIDVRFHGRNTGATGTMRLAMTPSTPGAMGTVSADNASNATWTFSAYMALIDGALPAATTGNHRLDLTFRDAAGANGIPQGNRSPVTPGSAGNLAGLRNAPISHQRFAVVGAATDAATAVVCAEAQFQIEAGTSYDFTVRIACPQLEAGRGMTAYIPTFGGANHGAGATRTGWTLFVNPAQFQAAIGAAAIDPAAGVTVAARMRHHLVPLGANLGELYQEVLVVRGPTNDNRFSLRVNARSSGQPVHANVINIANNTQDVDMTVANGAVLPLMARFSLAGAANSASANGALRGISGADDTSLTMNAATLNTLAIGLGGVQSVDNVFEEVLVWPTRLTNAQLSLITSQ